MKKRVLLLRGGISNEREVSIDTSKAIERALIKLGQVVQILDPYDYQKNHKVDYFKLINKIETLNPDVIFIGLHGGEGENGGLQKLFEYLNIPFTGSSSFSSAIAMNKKISKLLVKNDGFLVPEFLCLSKDSEIGLDKIITKFNFPIVVKPVDSGSSVGLSIIYNDDEIENAIELAFQHSNEIMFEEYIAGREITVAILEGKALPVVEVKPKQGWYDYKHKYTKGETIYEVPANLSEQETRTVQSIAEQIFKLLKCSGYARIDFRYNGNDFYFLELNTLPGMTELSLVPMSAKAAGISFEELINRILMDAFKQPSTTYLY